MTRKLRKNPTVGNTACYILEPYEVIADHTRKVNRSTAPLTFIYERDTIGLGRR
jgi:hypothetical protein